MKKVLYIYQKEYPWDVRAEKICKSLVEAGFRTSILSRGRKDLSFNEISGGINIIRTRDDFPLLGSAPLPGNPVWISAIKRNLEQFKPDLVIVRDLFLAQMTAKICNSMSIPVINDMAEHYPAAMRAWKSYNRSLFKRLAVHTLRIPDRLEKNAVKLMDGIIVVCEEQIQRLTDEFDYPKKNILVVMNTPPVEWSNKIITKKIKAPFVFGHHGHLTAEKSIDKFLDGFIKSNASAKGWRFRIAGAGECLPDLEKIARNESSVEFLGEYEFTQLKDILAGIDIGVLPYPVNDFNNHTLHNKIFDYFAAGIPVLTSLARPMRRLVDETGAGVSIDCSNPVKIAEFLNNIEKYDWNEFAENARRASIERYNWEADSRKFIEFIGEYI
ncbi:MAG: glycosyltransferase [Bacteroidota bacterium]